MSEGLEICFVVHTRNLLLQHDLAITNWLNFSLGCLVLVARLLNRNFVAFSLIFTFSSHVVLQMTCIRLLEILPVIFEMHFRSTRIVTKSILDLNWLQDLMDWGRSSLTVIVRYWKQTLTSLLSFFKKSCSDATASAIKTIEKLLSSGELYIFSLFFSILVASQFP